VEQAEDGQRFDGGDDSMSVGLRVRRISLSLLFAGAMTGLGPHGQGPRAASIKDPVRVNFACASGEVFAAADIQEAVREIVPPHGGAGSRVWGDRAVALDLNHDRRPEYLVPLSCGATCNCRWAIIALKPSRSLGVIEGCVLDLSVARRGWAQVTAYTHLSAGEGTLTTHDYRSGEYVKNSEVGLKPEVVESFERCKDNESCCP